MTDETAPMRIGGPDYVTLGQRIRRIILDAAQDHGVSPAEIVGGDRRPKVAGARRDAICRACAALPHLPVSEIGRRFNLHHTTVLYALGRLPSKPRGSRRRIRGGASGA